MKGIYCVIHFRRGVPWEGKNFYVDMISYRLYPPIEVFPKSSPPGEIGTRLFEFKGRDLILSEGGGTTFETSFFHLIATCHFVFTKFPKTRRLRDWVSLFSEHFLDPSWVKETVEEVNEVVEKAVVEKIKSLEVVDGNFRVSKISYIVRVLVVPPTPSKITWEVENQVRYYVWKLDVHYYYKFWITASGEPPIVDIHDRLKDLFTGSEYAMEVRRITLRHFQDHLQKSPYYQEWEALGRSVEYHFSWGKDDPRIIYDWFNVFRNELDRFPATKKKFLEIEEYLLSTVDFDTRPIRVRTNRETLKRLLEELLRTILVEASILGGKTEVSMWGGAEGVQRLDQLGIFGIKLYSFLPYFEFEL